MKALDRKLLRDLWAMRGMALAIALVLAGGIATFVMSLSTYDSLTYTQARYYREHRFGEVFARVKRAPESLMERVHALPGVERAESRVVATANVRLDGFPDPVIATLVSLPDGRESPLDALNALYVRQGRLPETGRDEEVVVADTFADAHGLVPGDRLAVVINGRQRQLDIVGIGLSPEYVYQLPPGGVFPDFERYAVLWMGRTALAAAYDLQRAFNDVTLTLVPGTSPGDVVDRLDLLLERYGGRGAFTRSDQLSHRFLSEELKGLEAMAAVFPTIFLGVAAFLLNVVVSRLIDTQREQVAILKAFGYSDAQVGLHFAKLVLVIVALGLGGGLGAGVWMGQGMSGVYAEFYRFPFLHFRLEPRIVVFATLIGMAAALAGTLLSLRRAAGLPPAQAMRPETPAVYRETLIERLGLQRWLAQPTRMIARHIERRPIKSLLTVVGIASACGIVVLSNFQRDAINYMIDVQYGLSQREDLALSFVEPTSHRAVYSLAALPGVLQVEAVRAVPVRLRHGHLGYRTSIRGVEPDGELYRLIDAQLQRVDLPPGGLILTDYLGELLGVRPGDMLLAEVLEGARPVLEIPVVGLAKQYMGVGAYMERAALNRLLGEGPAISGVFLALDEDQQASVYAAVAEMPRVAGAVVRGAAIDSFNRTMEQTILFFTFITALLGAIIAFGVVYNSARIALSERSRELASLRVLGFTQGEIAYILLGELALLTLAALPLGFLFGRGLCGYLAAQFRSDLYRVPVVVTPDTYAFAATVVLLSAVISGAILWYQLRHLDLIAVLKTRE
ncbi:MAG: ABC transporter permease [Gammaproteobacteria bacterium]